ncbi:MAG TPA: alpha/beta hydrolase [Acidimicrobiales bacterium]
MSAIVDDRVGGLAIYRHEGEPGAARVVFVHGSMDRGASFLKVTRRLGGLTMVRYDRRGYGRSVGAGVAGSMGEQVADLLAVVGDEPAVVVGHSLGGVIALTAAQAHPGLIPSVAAFESPMSWMPWWPTVSAGAVAVAVAPEVGPEEAGERFMRRMIGDERWERLPSRTRAERRSEGPALLAELGSIRSGPPYDPAQVTVPVLAGYGSESKPYHQEAAIRLAEWAPEGELMVIEGAGHAAQSSHPEDFVAFVRRAVARGTGTGVT